MEYENENQFPWTYDAPESYIIEPPEPPKPEKKKGGAGKLIALALCCSVLGGIIGAGAVMVLNDQKILPLPGGNSNVLEGNRENTVIDITQIDTGKVMTPAEVYAVNVNSTVGITTSITTNYWGYQTTAAASGSGFIFSDDGYILTNYHVVEDSSSIDVRMYDGTSYKAALIGYDASNDVAVLKIEATGLTPVILGNSDNLNVGDSVLAIGNPLGELTFSLTAGTVSALDREVTMSTGVTMNLLQTDCAINSGNSGGALFNLYGEVIGITNAKYSSSSTSKASIDNIGFAIPINVARNIAQSIIEKGYVAKPYIGVTVSNVSEETQSYGLPQGAAIRTVVEDSPAEKAGLQVNDIVTKVDDTPITGRNDLIRIVGEAAVGAPLKLTVYRSGQTIELTVTVGEKIQSAAEEQQQQSQQSSGFPFWGIPGFGG